MKLMTFNILYGGGDEERFQSVLKVIAAHQPDVLVMQECVGWEDGERLKAVTTALNIPDGPEHAQVCLSRPRGSGTRFHTAFASRFPVSNVRTFADPAFLGHSIVKFDVPLADNHVTVFGTHFDAHNENLRFVEARYLRSLIDPFRFCSGLYVLAGDLNALSRHDPYPPDFEDQLRRAGITKYHYPPRFDVIDDIEAFGWIDALRHRSQPDTWVTADRLKNNVHVAFRTDYVFVSPTMAKSLVRVEIPDVSGASDHNPCIAVFQA